MQSKKTPTSRPRIASTYITPSASLHYIHLAGSDRQLVNTSSRPPIVLGTRDTAPVHTSSRDRAPVHTSSRDTAPSSLFTLVLHYKV